MIEVGKRVMIKSKYFEGRVGEVLREEVELMDPKTQDRCWLVRVDACPETHMETQRGVFYTSELIELAPGS
jgi:hypothetical protein